jgi:multidrug transporter EmrE-like cation transporter
MNEGEIRNAEKPHRVRGVVHMIALRSIVLVVLVVVAGASAQVLLKSGINAASANLGGDISDKAQLFGQLLHSPQIWLALFPYAAGLAVWMVALTQLPLNFAYSFQALTYVLVPVASVLWLSEPIPSPRWVGILVICVAIVIVGVTR